MKVLNISTAEKIAEMNRVLVSFCTWAYVSALPLNSFMFVGLDGFGGFYIKNFTGMSSWNIERWNPPDNLPNIQLLLKGGYYSFEQRNQLPAVSAPNWSTLITGLPPSDTGIHDNDWGISDAQPNSITTQGLPPITGSGKAPTTMWRVIREQVKSSTMGAVYCWDWLSNMVDEDLSFKYNKSCEEADDDCVRDEVLSWINHRGFPDYSFVYFGSIDEAGHSHGWGSSEYYEAARKVDAHIGEIIAALKSKGLLDSLLIAVTADHGGLGNGHGGFDQANMETPLIFTNFGNKVKKGIIRETVSNVRFSPTVLNAVGIRTPAYMGRPLDILASEMTQTEIIIQQS